MMTTAYDCEDVLNVALAADFLATIHSDQRSWHAAAQLEHSEGASQRSVL